MIHGAGGGAWEFRFWSDVFQEAGWRTVARDLAPASKGLSHTRLEDYLSQLLSWGVAEPDALVGASMGGLLALQAAVRLRPKALILINPIPPRESGVRLPARSWPKVVRWSRTTLAETVEAIPDATTEVAAWATPLWRDESGLVLRQLWDGPSASKPSCPCLVLASERDLEVPLECSEAVAAWSGGELLRLADASHVGPLLGRSATACATLVLNWLSELTAESP